MADLDQFLKIVAQQGASDLHIAEGEPPKIRMHGDIVPIRTEPISHDEATRMLSEICGPRNWETFEQHGDLDFAVGHGTGGEVDHDRRLVCFSPAC